MGRIYRWEGSRGGEMDKGAGTDEWERLIVKFIKTVYRTEITWE